MRLIGHTCHIAISLPDVMVQALNRGGSCSDVGCKWKGKDHDLGYEQGQGL
jgi:hypothetical protein